MYTLTDTPRDLYAQYVATWVYHFTSLTLEKFLTSERDLQYVDSFRKDNFPPEEAARVIVNRHDDIRPGQYKRQLTCPSCDGVGHFDFDPERKPEPCITCNSEGRIWVECNKETFLKEMSQ